MNPLRLRHLTPAVLALSLGGCQLMGAAGSMMGSLLSVAVYLIAIAAPIVLAYYLYHRGII